VRTHLIHAAVAPADGPRGVVEHAVAGLQPLEQLPRLRRQTQTQTRTQVRPDPDPDRTAPDQTQTQTQTRPQQVRNQLVCDEPAVEECAAQERCGGVPAATEQWVSAGAAPACL
jgi:hypothetical protein